MVLKAVLFDLGLTLIQTASFPEIYRRILAQFDTQVSIDHILHAQNATAKEYDISTYDENRRKKFWIDYNVSLLKKLNIEKNIVFLATQIDELWWANSGVKVFPDVEPTLSGLIAKGLKLGLVSNGFKRDLDHVLRELKLEKWFDSIVCIDSCNCAKPDNRIFLYALDKLEIKPSEAIFVGDSIPHDYNGALRVGIKPYLLDREGKFATSYDKIAKLTELLEFF
jgi:HAD superfamily hydrolase (TIGR01549 family)